MAKIYNDLDRAQKEVNASSAEGAPFLVCYGLTFLVTGILAFNLPGETSALIALGVFVSLGAFTLVLFLKSASYSYILLLVGAAYWVAAPLAHRHAKAIVAASAE